jgi:hypothetical protein
MDDVKSQMEGVTRVYVELDNKISDTGGVQHLFGMNRKIRQALETISIGELDSMLAEIHRAKEGLTRLQEDVVEIRVLKKSVVTDAQAGERHDACVSERQIA